MKVRVVLFACVVMSASEGVFAADAGVPPAGAESGAARRYVEDVDAEGLSKLNPVLMRELASGVRDKTLKRTLLHAAAFSGDVDAIRALVYWGADLHAHDYRGETPLNIAVKEGQKKAITILLFLGAVWNDKGVAETAIVNGYNGTECKRVVDEAYAECCAMRASGLQLEPLFNQRMRRDATALLANSLRTQRSLADVENILVAGADVQAVFEGGHTMLHFASLPLFRSPDWHVFDPSGILENDAAIEPSIETLELLICHGAPLYTENCFGLTAEQIAREHGFTEAANFLAQASRWSLLRKVFVGVVVSAELCK
jgi:ankyrin repeat protein